MGIENPLDTVKRAANSLTPEYREIAFKWAVHLISTKKKLSEQKYQILEDLKIKLSIDSRVAESLIT
jgi:hypothetical protein